MSGVLFVVGTPIGNLDDLSPRAARTLAEADVIACEDTRVTRTLLTRVDHPSRAKLIAYHARNEIAQTPELVRRIAAGARVALVTDAGMPGLSDPGRRLVDACVETGLRVEVIPGPSAITGALVASGLPSARFTFEGFLPRTAGARRRRLEALRSEDRTLVFFEAPHRLNQTLDAMVDVFGDRRAAIAREMTKLHEQTLRAPLPELRAHFEQTAPRGEITIVVEGAEHGNELPVANPAELAVEVAALVQTGARSKDAIADVARARKLPKRVVYQAVLDARARSASSP